MVAQITFGSMTVYMHSAFATSPSGADFSLTEFDDALYVGNYTSASAEESTSPSAYKWHVKDEIDNGAEEEVEDGVDPTLYALQEDVGTLTVRANMTDVDISNLQEAVWSTEE